MLARRSAARAPRNDVFDVFQARPGFFVYRLARGDRGAKALHDRLGVSEALAQLGGLNLLGPAAGVEPALELRDVPGLPVGPPHQVPDQRSDSGHRGQEAYQEQREQQF